MTMEERLISHPELVLGVDPGLSGAAWLLGKGFFDGCRQFKTLPNLALSIQKLVAGKVINHTIFEFVHALPGQGVSSMFSFGKATGVALGTLVSCGLTIEEVAPQKWQNFFRTLLGIPKGTPFDSRSIAAQLLPTKAPPFLLRKLDHNSADAMLMAAWKILSV